MTQAVKMRLGDRLIAQGRISQAQLEVALSEQRRAHRPIGEILISLGFVEEEALAAILAEDLGIPFLRAAECHPDPLILSAVDADFVRETSAFPLSLKDGVLQVVMVNPGDPVKVSLVRGRFPYPLDLAITTPADLLALLKIHFGFGPSRVAGIFGDLADAGAAGTEFPVERMTNALLLDGVHRGATDVHLEPDERVTRVRYRIDGLLAQGENLPAERTAAIVSRIKILAGMDISERRRPQDGRIRLEVDGRQVDMRVSIMPCVAGENVVVRILDRPSGTLSLSQLGVASDHQKALAKIVDRSHGLFLVTGPTGSGKTTTLYSLLGTIDAMGRNVCTIEDPVEYRMPLLRQSQVDTGIGFGFQEGLRALLRQDPDVVLVGEIRDRETADMAVKASMTGHLVLSTLHTNSALGAVPRLVDIGIEPYLLEDALIGVLAQRLVRRVCRGCARPCSLSEADRRWLGDDVGTPLSGTGCERCRGTGYSGRSVICELFLPDDAIAEGIRSGARLSELQRLAQAAGFRNMTEDGKRNVRSGTTTREEIERVNRSHRFDEEERADV